MKFILCEVSSSFPAPLPGSLATQCMMGKKSVGGTLEIFTVLKGKRV